MFAAGIVHGMEAGDRTADAAHLELKKYPDRLRRSTHDIVNQIVKPNGHAHLRSEMNGNAALPGSVCSGANLAPNIFFDRVESSMGCALVPPI